MKVIVPVFAEKENMLGKCFGGAPHIFFFSKHCSGKDK
jgi:hypothetical protein